MLFSLTFFSCKESKQIHLTENYKLAKINEVFQSPRDESDNVDSPTFWHRNDTNWVISTAKSSDILIINDAITGEEIFRFGTTGVGKGQLKRPNGISVYNNFLFVVERDNKRVQVFRLPKFENVGFIGENKLLNPYGLFIAPSTDSCKLYITDDYKDINDNIPPDSLLDKRIVVYSFSLKKGLQSRFLYKFGEISGKGRLQIVESIFGDKTHDNLFIAEEKRNRTSIKLYTMEGKFKKSLGDDIFESQVEGIALYNSDSINGYWFVADQSMKKNIFHIFDRATLKYLGGFIGNKTLNTDGIWITQHSYGNFKKGAFFAINNDRNVSGFDLAEIADSLNLKL